MVTMEMGLATIKNFDQLDAWQEGHKLVLKIYRLTKTFPHEEKFGLTSQIRRSAASITANIAEGFGRISLREKIQYYNTAAASVTETQNHLYLSKDLHYISDEEFQIVYEQSITVHKLVNGLIKRMRILLQSS